MASLSQAFEPRKLMEMAIEVMMQSVNEPRSDMKASPLVGAALLKPDGRIETAYRGELRHGDHAEGDKILEVLNTDEKKMWEYLSMQTIVTRKQFAETMRFDAHKAQRHLKRFAELGLLQKVGATSATKYEVNKA